MGDIIKIRDALLSFGDLIDPQELFPSLNPDASKLVINNPYALALAISLDRGTKAEIIWTIPYYLSEQFGHLDPQIINLLTIDELATAFSNLPHKPRYINAAPRTVMELTNLIVSAFDGDTSKMWKGKSAFEVKSLFQSIYGVGPGIANMSVLLLEKAYKYEFSDLDRKNMDIKPDVHTKRVLYRLGASESISESAAIEASRKMNPNYPGRLDAPLWIIGRKWCQAQNPACQNCPMNYVCQKIELN